MSVANKLGKILLLITLSILTSCSGGDKASSPSLNADDIWDQMAAERQKPLPVNSTTDDSDEILTEMPFGISSGQLSTEDIEAYRSLLRAARGKFQDIGLGLEDGYAALAQEGGAEENKKAQRRTVELYLSRLITLRNNMNRAVNALGEDDQTLMDKSRDLMVVMTEYIVRTRNRLDE